MKHIQFAFICMFIFMQGISQQNAELKVAKVASIVSQYSSEKFQEIVQDTVDQRFFSRKAYDLFFDKYFTLINYQRETFTDGNSAALKISEDKTNLNLTLSKKAQNFIFSIGTILNVSDQSGTLFTGNKPTAGTQFFFNQSYLLSGKRLLKFEDDERQSNYQKRLQVVDSVANLYTIRNPVYISVLLRKLAEADSAIEKTQGELMRAVGKDTVLKYQEALVKAIDEKEKLKNELKKIDSEGTPKKIGKTIVSASDKIALAKELETSGVTIFRMQWFSIGGSYRKDTYGTYDSLLHFDKRIGEKQFDGIALNGSYNFYWQRTEDWIAFRKTRGFNSFYGNINYTASKSNSYADITETTLSIINSISSHDTTYEFSSQQKLRPFAGKSFNELWVHRIGLQTTGMLGMKQFFGLNLSGNAELAKTREPVFNTRLGLLFRFIDSEDEKSRVNFEVFLSLKDLQILK